jgi:hypothetical protein
VPAVTGRLASVDALRGLTILLMIFVNDLGPAAPSWMHHIQPENADGMTLADVVFPAFLFIVGVSIPLALERARLQQGARLAQVRHIIVRTLGLLLMGVMVNYGEHDRTLGGALWSTLAFTAVLLAWCTVPREQGTRRYFFLALKALGWVGLMVLLAIFRSEPQSTEIPFVGRVESWVWLRTEWWGILGLIGWAYLAVAILWLILGERREWLMGALASLIVLHLSMQRGLFSRFDDKAWLGWTAPIFKTLASWIDTINQYVGLGDALGSLAAITMAGCLLGSILRSDQEVATHRDRLRWALTFTIGLLLAGFLTDSFEGINKIAATPTWCLWSAAITCATWMLLYLVMDIAIIVVGIGLAGFASPLLDYQRNPDPLVVVAGSLGMALLVCVVTGLLGRLGLRVKL